MSEEMLTQLLELIEAQIEWRIALHNGCDTADDKHGEYLALRADFVDTFIYG